MPLGLFNVEFLTLNSQRRYPLADDAVAIDVTGAFHLPNDFLVELDFPLHAGIAADPASFFLKSISAYAGGFVVVIGYQPETGDPVDAAAAVIARSGHTRNANYALVGTGDFVDSVGSVAIGKFETIDSQPPGMWTFDLAGGRLDPDAVRPTAQGVTGIVLVNGGETSQPLQGIVELRAGRNCQLVPTLVEGEDPVVTINFLQGEGTSASCECDGDPGQEPIQTINGVRPDSGGNINIVGTTCMSVEGIANGIRLSDNCAEPCCGPDELEAITRDLEELQLRAATVENFLTTLNSSVTTMNATVLGARLGNRGCVSCG